MSITGGLNLPRKHDKQIFFQSQQQIRCDLHPDARSHVNYLQAQTNALFEQRTSQRDQLHAARPLIHLASSVLVMWRQSDGSARGQGRSGINRKWLLTTQSLGSVPRTWSGLPTITSSCPSWRVCSRGVWMRHAVLFTGKRSKKKWPSVVFYSTQIRDLLHRPEIVAPFPVFLLVSWGDKQTNLTSVMHKIYGEKTPGCVKAFKTTTCRLLQHFSWQGSFYLNFPINVICRVTPLYSAGEINR